MTSWNHPRPTTLSIHVFGAKAPAVAYLPKSALRELRDAINRILGDVAIRQGDYAALARVFDQRVYLHQKRKTKR